jgi:signal transduction histidine kinase
LFVVVYVIVDAAAYVFANAPLAAAPWNPQPALAVTLVAIGGVGYMPAVIVSVFLAEALTGNGTGLGPAYFVACVGVAAAYCGAGWAVRRWTRWPSGEPGLLDLTIFFAVAAVTGFIAAGSYVLGYGAADTAIRDSLGGVSAQMMIGDVLGLVIGGPLLLLLFSRPWREWLGPAGARGTAWRDLALFVLVLAGVLLVVFGLKPFDEFRMFYLMFLPMIAVAMRYGLRGAVIALPFVQVGLIAALAAFATHTATAFEFQLLMLTLAVTSLYLGATWTERERAAERLSRRERELREQREALSEAQRTASTSELAAAVAHDLNQPLSAIGTFARACRLMVERGEPDRAMLLKTLDQIGAESARAGQYVRRMRDFFRTGAMREERVDVRELIETAHAHLRDRLQREGVGWTIEIEPDLPPARGDEVQLGAVLDNLFANACDAMHAARGARMLRIAATRVAGAVQPMVRITVEDTGPGVPLEVREQLFKPLATSKPHGMGLGLALSRSIAERLGGDLWFDADRPLTTFCLDLPAHD